MFRVLSNTVFHPIILLLMLQFLATFSKQPWKTYVTYDSSAFVSVCCLVLRKNTKIYFGDCIYFHPQGKSGEILSLNPKKYVYSVESKRTTNANKAYYALLPLLKSQSVLRAEKIKIWKILRNKSSGNIRSRNLRQQIKILLNWDIAKWRYC